jgi:hypothetical protein
MPDDKKQLQQAIMDTAGKPREFVAAVHAYYRNRERSDETPRELLYLHLGMAIGVIMRLTDERDEEAARAIT